MGCSTRAIPARAGEPVDQWAVKPTPGGHPRAGGGACSDRSSAWSTEGPSPRGRGSHLQLTFNYANLGAIPARAGEPPPHSR